MTMDFNLGPIELLLALALWLVPIALLAWFVWAILGIRRSLRRIEQRLELPDSR